MVANKLLQLCRKGIPVACPDTLCKIFHKILQIIVNLLRIRYAYTNKKLHSK